MRLNKWLAEHSRYSRRAADALISQGKVVINGQTATVGQPYNDGDTVLIDGKIISRTNAQKIVVLLHKPVGYVCSRNGQGAQTVYSLIPVHLHNLDIAGRLDKDSSGLVVLTNDGMLLHDLTHPSHNKVKEYIVSLDRPLASQHQAAIQQGVKLEDGLSKLQLVLLDASKHKWQVNMQEGRNRQIRRTFEALGYTIVSLHRTRMDDYMIGTIPTGKFVQQS
jgi:pseudouridine synthase